MVFSGTFMGLLYTLGLLWQTPGLREMAMEYPLAAATLAGTLVFPLAKTIIESFDGSTAFFRRRATSPEGFLTVDTVTNDLVAMPCSA